MESLHECNHLGMRTLPDILCRTGAELGNGPMGFARAINSCCSLCSCKGPHALDAGFLTITRPQQFGEYITG